MAEELPVVFVPGLGCTARLFAHQIASLGERRCRVADHARHDAIGAIAESVLAEAPERFALVGLSMGGYVAFEILRRAPDRVARLALLDTTAEPDTEEGRARRRTLIAAARKNKLGSIHQATFARYVDLTREGDAALEALVREMLFETGAPAFARQMTAILTRPEQASVLPGLRCPTLVLVGENDLPTPPEHARRMAAAIPDARLVVLPGVGHLSAIEAPEAVSAELVAFLG
ncbi:hydrolase [Methylopila jiangsuensis]|uniref:Hydrolase n=1 Tax=Methylopila jiangsuensis TaxID=586230 RepID=A0A9W6N2T8_9HYPH|nr:alpha/beta fold hydrolase [Methylopila jiangsuensis]MDR6285867.1 pimeloyl-ACP methyl ester carboxylesterase [Methylopila jiangsuensis]GLK75625.1 hydrolase [Methylopila jiangsuensis]